MHPMCTRCKIAANASAVYYAVRVWVTIANGSKIARRRTVHLPTEILKYFKVKICKNAKIFSARFARGITLISFKILKDLKNVKTL